MSIIFNGVLVTEEKFVELVEKATNKQYIIDPQNDDIYYVVNVLPDNEFVDAMRQLGRPVDPTKTYYGIIIDHEDVYGDIFCLLIAPASSGIEI